MPPSRVPVSLCERILPMAPWGCQTFDRHLNESVAGSEGLLLHYRDPRRRRPMKSGPCAPRETRQVHGGAVSSVGRRLLMDAKQVWRAVLGELQVSLSPANFETWLKDTSLVDLDENRYRIAAPNGFARDWLHNRHRTLISQTLARVVGGSVQVEFVVADAPGPVPSQADDDSLPLPPASASGNTVNLSGRYSFSNFIVGSANRLAHAAALSVAERPGHAYNPLFLYGGVGLGKTHL